MKSEVIDHINQAFLQLEFSIKLLTYAELRKIDKEDFDSDLLIGQGDLSFNHSSFDTYEDLMLAAHNNFNITVGFTAIVLDSSFNSAGILPNPNDRSLEGALRTLIYIIRCAYAHNMMYPKWEVRGAYAHILEIPLKNEIIKLNLTQKHGAPFDMQDIGGYKNYFDIKDSICELILKH